MGKESVDWLILVLPVEGKIIYLEKVLMLTKVMVNGMREKPWRLDEWVGVIKHMLVEIRTFSGNSEELKAPPAKMTAWLEQSMKE